VNWQVFHPTWEKVRLLEHHKTLKDCEVKDGDTLVFAHVHVVGLKKIPIELFCFNCLTYLEWTGCDTGEYLVYKCPKCNYLLGVKIKTIQQGGEIKNV
jgi:phage FluMu protein Com